ARPARRLSGGEQQRLALARALARDPTVLFLDEPTASLDPAATQLFEEIIRTISARGIKVVMATHDLGEARRLAGDIILLHRGQALDTARRGDADVVLVHAKAAEEKFLAEGFGVKRFPVMYNDFVVIGPTSDPAGITGSKDVAAALRAIKAKAAPFISRGDKS